MRRFVQRFPVVSFFALAYAFSWAYWIPMLVTGAKVAPGSSTTHFPGLAGPAIAACIVQAACHGTSGLAALLRRLTAVSRPLGAFWIYSLSPVVFLAVALGVMAVAGRPLPGAQDFARFSGLPELGLPAVVILVFLIGGCGEELGWRGFALERLQQRFGPLGGAVVLAVLWAGWHAPAFGVIETYRMMTIPMIAGGFFLGLTCGSIVLARVGHVTSGSVLAASLWHATYNLTAATSAGAGFVSACTTALVMTWAGVLIVVEARRPREHSLLSVPPLASGDESPCAVTV